MLQPILMQDEDKRYQPFAVAEVRLDGQRGTRREAPDRRQPVLLREIGRLGGDRGEIALQRRQRQCSIR